MHVTTAAQTECLWIRELTPGPEPVDAFMRLNHLKHCLFLDSAMRHASLGRYSFLAVDPFEFLTAEVGAESPFRRLQELLVQYAGENVPELPPFQGGLAGLFSYDLNRAIERLPDHRRREFDVPALAIGAYDLVISWDHQTDRSWIVSTGLPEVDRDRRRVRAESRGRWLERLLAEGAASIRSPRPAEDHGSIAAGELAPQFPVGALDGLTSNFDEDTYRQAVEQVIEYIYAGDIFQANFAQRLIYPAHDSSIELYQRLRTRNAATFASYLDCGKYQIASASPERLISIRDRCVESRPIKGTCPKISHPEADYFAGQSLLESTKDRAENIMIVDLVRNDLSRVCEADSVVVDQLCGLESYRFVQHLVSCVRGTMREDADAVDVLKAVFPGGSISGAPKIRAMEIIAELEPTARGAYCGSIGYLGFNGNADLNILIRTITCGGSWWQLPVGGGIVADSQPQREYEETWHKAEGLIRALRD